MKLAQLKWIGLAVVATGLSAGGAIGFAAVSAQDRAATDGTRAALGEAAEPQEAATTSRETIAPGATVISEARMRAFESQIDRIYRLNGLPSKAEPRGLTTLDRVESKLKGLLGHHDESTEKHPVTSGTQASSAQATRPASPANTARAGSRTSSAAGAPTVASSATTAPADSSPSSSYAPAAWNDYRARAGEGSGSKIRELEAQLKHAQLSAERAERLHQSASISQAEFQEARSKVDLTLAALQGMDDDFSDELPRLKLIIKKKAAELDQARAQKEVAMVVVARNNRLNTRQPGIVGQDEVAKAEAEVRSADAHIRVKEVEHEEPELQLQNVERWRARVRQILDTMQKQAAGAEPTGTSGATQR